MTGARFLDASTLKILALGVIAFGVATAAGVLMARITSYNVCYTKLLRVSVETVTFETSSAAIRPEQARSLAATLLDRTVGSLTGSLHSEGMFLMARITSYNVCYTKLLRARADRRNRPRRARARALTARSAAG